MFHLLPTKFHPNRYKIDRIKEGEGGGVVPTPSSKIWEGEGGGGTGIRRRGLVHLTHILGGSKGAPYLFSGEVVIPKGL